MSSADIGLPKLWFAIVIWSVGLIGWIRAEGETNSTGSTSDLKILCIGDSITAGRFYNWRYHLSRQLEREGYAQVRWVGLETNSDYKGAYPDFHEGHYGATSAQMIKAAQASIDKFLPDIAIIHLGTNDISQKIPPEEAAENIGKIIDALRVVNGTVAVLVCQIPHPAGSADFNHALETMIAARHNPEAPLIAVDLATGWNAQPGIDTYDWIHPNLRGALVVTNRLHDALVPLLGKPIATPQTASPVDTKVNLALNKKVAASAEKGGKAASAVDGDPMTMWAATPIFSEPLTKPEQIVPQWIEVDLGQARAVQGIGIIWDVAGASYDYKVEVSTDEKSWSKVVEKVKSNEISVALEPEVDEFAAQARFVRVTVTNVPNVNFPNYRTALPAAIRELKVY